MDTTAILNRAFQNLIEANTLENVNIHGQIDRSELIVMLEFETNLPEQVITEYIKTNHSNAVFDAELDIDDLRRLKILQKYVEDNDSRFKNYTDEDAFLLALEETGIQVDASQVEIFMEQYLAW